MQHFLKLIIPLFILNRIILNFLFVFVHINQMNMIHFLNKILLLILCESAHFTTYIISAKNDESSYFYLSYINYYTDSSATDGQWTKNNG